MGSPPRDLTGRMPSRAVRRLSSRPEGRVWWALAAVVALAATAVVGAGLSGGSSSGVPISDVASEAARSTADARVVLALSFEQHVLEDIAAYRGPRRVVALASRALGVLVPMLLAVALLSPRSRRAPRALERLPGVALPVAAMVASASVAIALVRLPLAVWAGVVHDGAWGFRTRSVGGWALDHLGMVAGRALLLGLITAGVVHIIRRHPHTWPARLTLLAAVAGPVALLMHPLIVHPLLLPTAPLPDGPHRDAVHAVVARSDRPDVEVLLGEASLRTTRRNAVVTGLGPTERIVLHDTLLELTPREVAAITAHELAHVERRDPLRGVLAPVPVVLLLGLAARRRVAGLPASPRSQVRALAAMGLLLLALETASSPLSSALSRTVEHRTDVRAVALSGDPEATIEMLRSFVIHGLAEPDPPRWSVLLWATHPAPSTRIRAVLGAQGELSAEWPSGQGDHATR